MRLQHLVLGAAVVALVGTSALVDQSTGAGQHLRAAPDLPYRPVRRRRHSDRQRHERLPRDAQRARRRHRRREDRHRGMRDRLRHQEGRRVLRAGQGEEAGGGEPVFDRHHAAADPEGRGRQGGGAVDGLRPLGLGRRTELPLDLQSARDLLGRAVDHHEVHRREVRRSRQAQGQDHRLHLLRRRLRPRADPAARAVRQGLRLHREAVSGAGGRDAEPVRPVAQRAPRPSGLDGDVGLGRHEPDRRQGSHQDQLPDGQVRRHLVVGQRGRHASVEPREQGLSVAEPERRSGRTTRRSRTSRSTSSTRARARPRPTSSARTTTIAACSTP